MTDWGQVQTLEPCLPALEELYLCGNGIKILDVPAHTYSDWKQREGDVAFRDAGNTGGAVSGVVKGRVSGFANLRILDLTDNEIADWRQVLRLSDLPALQRLAIGGNQFSQVRRDETRMDTAVAPNPPTPFPTGGFLN